MYALQEFHGLFKQLANLLHDVGHPVTKPSLVINTLHGLNSKFSQAISTITAMKSLPSFLHVSNYLLQEENR
jgi:hypothetical protein